MRKKTKVAIVTFIVLGVTGLAILKAQKIYKDRRAKKGRPQKKGLLNQLFELPDDLKS